MFRRQRYRVFHWIKSNKQVAGLVALLPDLSDAEEHAERILSKHGLEPAGPENNWFRSLIPGIPKLSWASAYSEKEIRFFLLAVGRSRSWDFNSILALEFEPKELGTPFYSSMLEEIERSINRRCWLHDKFGMKI